MAGKIIGAVFGGGKKKTAAATTTPQKGPVVAQLNQGNLTPELRRRMVGKAIAGLPNRKAGVNLVNTTGKLGA